MPDVKISAFTAATSVAPTDEVAGLFGGGTKRASVALLRGTTDLASSAVAGTLPVAKGGTGLTALGTAGFFVRVNAAGTALEYVTAPSGGTGATSPAGVSGDVQFNNAGAFGGATDVKAGAGFISVGTGVATTGALRLGGAVAKPQIVWNDGVADRPILRTEAGGNGVLFGDITYGLNIYGTSLTLYASNGATFIYGGSAERMRVEGAGSSLVGGSGDYGGGDKVAFIGNATTVPTTNPVGGVVLYSEAGVLKFRGSAGVVVVGSGGGGGAPGGLTTQLQYNSAGAFAGIAGLTFDGTRVVAASSALKFANPAGTFGYIVAGSALAADRVVTLPLLTAADTFAMLAFAQTFTNKTLVAASNTITDTSAALGDLFYHNGTRFVRLPRGATGQVLTATATTINWAAPSGGVGGVTYAFVTDANYTVTAAQAAFEELEFTTGVITAPRTVTFPAPASKAVGYRRTVFNDSLYALTVSTGVGSSEVLLPGQRRLYWFDNGGVRLDETATNVVPTADAVAVYRTLATLAVGEVRQLDLVAVISKSDGTVRQVLKWSGLVYGAAGPTATFDTSPGVSSSLTGTGAAVLSVEVTGAIVRLKIVGIAATALSTKYDVTVL